MASGVLEVIIKAVDEYSKVVDGIQQKNESLAKEMQRVYDTAAAAISGAGIGIEAFARKNQDTSIAIAQLANDLGMTKDQIRKIAASVSDASTPLDEVISLMDLAKKQGITDAEGLKQYAEYWSMVGDATGESSVVLAEAAVGLRALGITAENVSDSAAALGFVTNNTTISATEFLSTVSRLAPQLKDAGISINDVAVYLAALEQKGITGRAALSEFREALTKSGGDTQILNQMLGVSKTEFESFSQKVAASGTALADNAAIVQQYQTPLQELQSKLGDVAMQYGDVVAQAAQFAPALMVIGPAIEIFSRLSAAASSAGGMMALLTSTAGSLGPALMAAAPYIAAIGAAIAGLYYVWTNNLFGIQEATASAVDFIKDRLAGMADGMKPAMDKLGEWAGKIGEHLGRVFEKFDQLVRKLTGGSGIFDILGAVIEKFGQIWDNFWSRAGTAIEVAVDLICQGIDLLISAIETLIDWWDKVTDHPIVKFLTNTLSQAAQLAGKAFDTLFPPLEKTNDALEKTSKTAEKTSTSLAKSSGSAKKLADSASSSVKGVKDLDAALDEIVRAAEDAAKGTQKASEETKRAGDAAKDASGKFKIAADDIKNALLSAVNGSSTELDRLRDEFLKSGGSAQDWARIVMAAAEEIEKEWGKTVTMNLEVLINAPSGKPSFLSDYQNYQKPSGATDILAQAQKYTPPQQNGSWKNYGTDADPKWYYIDATGRTYGPYKKNDISLLPSSAVTTAPASSSGTTSYPEGVTVTGQSELNPGKNLVEGEIQYESVDREAAKARAAKLHFSARSELNEQTLQPSHSGIIAAYDEEGNPIAQWKGYYNEVQEWAEKTGATIQDSFDAYTRYVGRAGNKTFYWGEAVAEVTKQTEDLTDTLDTTSQSAESATQSLESASQTLQQTGKTAQETAQTTAQAETTRARAVESTAKAVETSAAREVGTVTALNQLRERATEIHGQNVNTIFSGMGRKMGETTAAAANDVLAAFEKMRAGAASLANTSTTAATACTSCAKGVAQTADAAAALSTSLSGVISSGTTRVTTPTIVKPPSWFSNSQSTLKKLISGQIPLMAEGGDILSGGLAVVGERGPELLNVPAGATVAPLEKGSVIDYDRLASAIARAIGGGGGMGKEVHLHTSMIVADDAGLKKLARLLKSINISENVRVGTI